MFHFRPRVAFLLILLILLPVLLAASPPRQGLPDLSGFAVYGVPWVLVGLALAGLLVRYAGLTDEGRMLFAAGWATIGYLVIQNLPDLEILLPWLPTYLPQVLWAVLIFGSQLGLVPGSTARRVIRAVRR